MNKKNTFRLNKIAAGVSIALAASSMAYAQSSESQVELNNEGTELEELVVTGIRGSLLRSQAVKQDSSSVIEAISAEDIGKLPDSSIAESLSRLPGLAGERRNGRTSGISVRGFREDFVGTTINGRQLIGIGDNRGIEYDLYPSEIISGVIVHKSADASLGAMGVGGTVDLQTRRPLDSEPVLTFNGSFEQNAEDELNPDFSNTGHRLAASYSDSFADGTVGVALSVATLESPTQTAFNSVWGYTSDNVTSGPYAGFTAPDGIDISARSRVLERDTISGVLQFAPNDNLNITFDFLDIDFSESGIARGFIEDLGNAGDGSGVRATGTNVDVNGNVINTITGATATPFHSVIRSDPLNKEGELTTVGLNFEYAISDTWSAELDFAHSESAKSDQRAESYAGVGRAGLPTQGPQSVRNWTATDQGIVFNNNNIDYSSYDLVRLAGPQAWGGSIEPLPELGNTGVPGISGQQAQDGFDNTALFDEELDSIRLDFTKEISNSVFTSAHFGITYSDHSKSKTNNGFFLTGATFPFDAPVPAEFRRGVTDLSFAGLGSIVAYDARAVIDSSFYTRNAAATLEADRLGDTYKVSEQILSPYVKFEFDTEWGDTRVFGNLGVKVNRTEQESEGFNTRRGADLRVIADPIKGGAEYTKVLPSLNLNFDFGEGHIARVALSKVTSRPRIDHLGAGASLRFDNAISFVTSTDPESSAWKSKSGNAELEPYEANQFDLSYEWYYSDIGYLSASVFYKDLVNWHRAGKEVRDFSDVYIPEFHRGVASDGTIFTPATFLGINSFREDGLTGDVKGLELRANVEFGDFSEALEGLGLLVSASFSDGELNSETDNPAERLIPGLSEDAYKATLFYQKGGFEARLGATYRSEFLSEIRGGSNSLSDRLRAETTVVDGQLSYDFADSSSEWLDGLRVSFQVQNLNDEDDQFLDLNTRLLSQSESYGRTYLLTFNYDAW